MMSEAQKLSEDITALASQIQDGERRLEGLRAEASVRRLFFVLRFVSFTQGLHKWKPMVPEMGRRSRISWSSSLELALLDSTTRGGAWRISPSSRRVHEERMTIFVVPRDAQHGLRGVRVGEATQDRRAPTHCGPHSNVPATHPLTNVDETESVASCVSEHV